MDQKFLETLRSFLESLHKEHAALIEEFIPAKVLDPVHAEQLSKKIKKIEEVLREIMDADTAEKMKAALVKARDSLA